MTLQVKALDPKIGTSIPFPYYATKGAAALDLHACIDAPVTILSGAQVVIPTGIAVAIPENYVGIIAVRSSMGVRNGVSLSNDIGVIDSDYRGPLGVGLRNNKADPYTIQPGDRIAQLMVIPVACPEIEVGQELPASERGEGGFGSTGV